MKNKDLFFPISSRQALGLVVPDSMQRLYLLGIDGSNQTQQELFDILFLFPFFPEVRLNL